MNDKEQGGDKADMANEQISPPFNAMQQGEVYTVIMQAITNAQTTTLS